MPRPRRPAAPAVLPAVSLAVVLALVLAGLLAACGASEDVTTTPREEPSTSQPSTPEPTTPASPTATAPAPPAPDQQSGATALTVTVDDGAGRTTTRTLTCDPVGGDVPDPAAACAGIAAAGPAALAPVRTDLACAMQFGGPQTATVTGTVQGRPVTADYSRTDGCQTARWDALAPLLGAAEGGGSGGPDS